VKPYITIFNKFY